MAAKHDVAWSEDKYLRNAPAVERDEMFGAPVDSAILPECWRAATHYLDYWNIGEEGRQSEIAGRCSRELLTNIVAVGRYMNPRCEAWMSGYSAHSGQKPNEYYAIIRFDIAAGLAQAIIRRMDKGWDRER